MSNIAVSECHIVGFAVNNQDVSSTAVILKNTIKGFHLIMVNGLKDVTPGAIKYQDVLSVFKKPCKSLKSALVIFLCYLGQPDLSDSTKNTAYPDPTGCDPDPGADIPDPTPM